MAEKSFQKNSSADSQTVLVELQQATALMTSVRWGSETQVAEGGEVELPEAIAELCERPVLQDKIIDIERLTYVSPDDIIDRFLHAENLRVVVEESAPEVDIVTSAEIDDEDYLVSEELAEVYLKQGLNELAKETYRKLSLLNPEKSIYFAEIIAKIDSNN
ncbi:MAG: hypothetical protein J6L75_06505 [Alistipes sp.]|nr:hypothetical protein [Alistipes sp.]